MWQLAKRLSIKHSTKCFTFSTLLVQRFRVLHSGLESTLMLKISAVCLSRKNLIKSGATIILLLLRKIRSTRNYIHCNLFLSIIISTIFKTILFIQGHGWIDNIDICAITFLTVYGTILQMTWTLFEGLTSKFFLFKKWLISRGSSASSAQSILPAKTQLLPPNYDHRWLGLSACTCSWSPDSCDWKF